MHDAKIGIKDYFGMVEMGFLVAAIVLRIPLPRSRALLWAEVTVATTAISCIIALV